MAHLRLLIFNCADALKVRCERAAEALKVIPWMPALSAAGRSVGARAMGFELHQTTPDHTTILRTRRLIDIDTHRTVFTWVLGMLAEEGLLKGRVAIDGTTLEANAALRSIVRRETDVAYEEFLDRAGERIRNRDAHARATGETGSQAAAQRLQSGLGQSA